MPIYNSVQPRAADAFEARRREEAASRAAFSPNPDEAQSGTEPPAPARPAVQRRRWRINLPVLLGSLFVAALIMAVVRVLSLDQPDLTTVDKLQLLIDVPTGAPGPAQDVLPNDGGPEADLTVILGPLVAVAIAIERLIEAAFDWYERSATAVADVLVKPREALNWIEEEYIRAYEATAIAADQVRVDVIPGELQRLGAAENRLAEAEARLRSWTNASEYVAFKRAFSIWIGLLTGLIVAIWGGLSFFQAIELRAPLLLDMLVTGLLIGIGPGPFHTVIGIFQGAKDSLKSLADLLQARSVQEAFEGIQGELTPNVPQGAPVDLMENRG